MAVRLGVGHGQPAYPDPIKATQPFVKLLELNRNISWDLLNEDQIDVFEDRLAREIGGPNWLTLPPKTT